MNACLTPLDGTPLSDATLYRHLVGSLVYLTVTRPDIAHAVHLVSQFLSAPHSTHYAAVLHILRYIKGTMFHGLHFSAHSTLDLCAYSDADWAGDPTDRRSTTGFCFFLGDSLISWRSKKQHIVSRSSTEAEYRALADTTSELLALRWLLEDMGVTHSSPTVIHCDNRSAIQIAHNDVFHERTKHIEIDCHLVRHHLSAGILHLLPVSSSDQTANIFTKTFPPGRFRDLVSKLKMASVKPP
uniref:Reverse transcriptase Ty1/copia-type domain-containing protein n=1 Tax=Fagus sylvatica TaxID=28930 RepID=A0A2N9EUD9_FAGSY